MSHFLRSTWKVTHLILYKRDCDGNLHGIIAAGEYGEDLYGDLDV